MLISMHKTESTKFKLSKSELLQHLLEQHGFLVNSARSFDRGQLAEVKRLALTMRVLLHNTKNQQALLKQLGILYTMRFLDTARDFTPGNLVPESPLTLMRMGFAENGIPSATFMPILDEVIANNRRREFSVWWNQNVVEDSERHKFNRRQLVLTMADKDGGSHIDPKIDLLYKMLKDGNTSGWGYQKDVTRNPSLESKEVSTPSLQPIPNQLAAAVRQIAHEVIRSIEAAFPNFVGVYPLQLRVTPHTN